jgi:sugar/nucleoside kinase (ribokinase family)
LALHDDFLDEVQGFLSGEIADVKVVVMPDFFLDRLVTLSYDGKTFTRSLEKVAMRKGGSIDGIKQTDIRGGNAVNTALALATLGVKVTPIVCTSDVGLQILRLYLKPYELDFSHVKISEEPSITTAIELQTKTGKVNVMLRDIGWLANFGPQNLKEEDYDAIEKADYVCVFNWAGTRQFGTELAKTVFHHVKTKGKGRSYYDTADPIPNEVNIPQLVKKVLQNKDLDVLSVNENEAVCYAGHLSDETRNLGKRLPFEDLAEKSAGILATHLHARVDLHTTSFSATFSQSGVTIVPAFDIPVLRATGSGDAWNAGNILGDAGKLSDGGRLALANAVAAYYISSSNGTHPSRMQLSEFCRKKAKR